MRHNFAVMLVAAAIAVPDTVRAQGGGRATLLGTVYDSLAGAPLAGAHVYLRGLTLDAVTDRAGRFRIDSVPAGAHVVAFEHPDLDSIGLTSQAVRLTLAAGATLDVVLATRSAATLRRAACGDRALGPAGDSGVVFGSVVDAESGVRLAGAAALAMWTVITRTADGSASPRPLSLVTRTDSVGAYYLCGVPNDVDLVLQARADSFASGGVDVRVGPRQLLRRDLAVSREPLRVVATGPRAVGIVDSTAVRRGQAVLIGTVIEERGQPRAGALVALDDAATTVTTDERGRFVLTGLPSGSRMVTARIVGYTAARVPVELRNRDTVRVTLRLRAITVLDTIRIVASGRLAQLRAEIQARRRTASGTTFNEEEIRQRSDMRALLYGVSGVNTYGVFSTRWHVTMVQGPRECYPAIFIDGIKATIEELQAYRNIHLVALEIYPRPASSLGRYYPSDGCGVILAWTRLLR
jgi:hypothetical protein